MTELEPIRGKLTLDGKQFFVTLEKASDAVEKFGKKSNKGFGQFETAAKRTGKASDKFGKTVENLNKKVGQLRLSMGSSVKSTQALGKVIITIDSKMKGLKDSTGSATTLLLGMGKATNTAASHLRRLRLFIRNSAQTMKGFGRTIGSVGSKIGSIRIPIDRAGRIIRGFGKIVGRVNTRVRKFSGAVGKIGSAFVGIRAAIGVAGAAFASFKIVDFAADISNADQSFKSLTRTLGVDSTVALGKFRKAAKGTVSDLQLMRQVNSAVILGVADSVPKFEKLINAARILGKATGRTAAQGFEDLSLGIGRQSRLILDNLGLIVSVDRANKDFARSIGKTVKELTVAQRRTAFLNETLRAIDVRLIQLGQSGINFADVVGQIKSSVSNFAANVARQVTPALRDLLESLQSMGTKLGGVANLLASVLGPLFKNLATFVRDNGDQVKTILGTTINLVGKFILTLQSMAIGLAELIIGLATDPLKTLEKRFGAFVGGLSDVFIGFGKAIGAGIVEVLILAFGDLGQLLADELAGVFGVDDKLGDRFKAYLKQSGLDLAKQKEEGLLQGTLGTGEAFLEGLLGITPAQQKNLQRQFSKIDKLTKAFFSKIAKSSKSFDVDPATATKAFEAIKDVLNTTSEQLAASGSDLVAFRDLLTTLKIAKSAGTFKVEGADANEFLKVTNIIEAAIIRRGALLEKEAADAKQKLKDNKELGKLIDDLVTKLRQTATQLKVIDLPKEEQALAELERVFKEKLGDLNLADPKEIAEAERQLRRLIGLSRFLTESQARQAAEVLKVEKARKAELAALEKVAALTSKLGQDLKSSELDISLFELKDKDEKSVREFLAKVTEQIDAIALIKPEEAERLKGLLDDVVAARRELAKLEKGLRETKDVAEGQSIVSEFQGELASFGQSEFTRAIKDLEKRFLNAKIELNNLEVSDKEKARLKLELETAVAGIKIEIDKEETAKNIQPLVDAVTSSFQAAGDALVQSILAGESATRAIANALAGQLSAALNESISQIGKGLSSVFTTVFKNISEQSGRILGGIFSAAIGIIGAIIAKSKAADSDFSEADIEEIATSQSVVRGIVAGPTTIPIAEVGSSLREAFRTSEDLLRSINETLGLIAGGGDGSSALGAGQGALTT